MGIWVICLESIDWVLEMINILCCIEEIKVSVLDVVGEVILYFDLISGREWVIGCGGGGEMASGWYRIWFWYY